MTAPLVSVVVLNRDRIRSLARTLIALKHQSLRGFEVVVVSNQTETIKREIPQIAHTTLVPLAEANISRARNLGVAAAHGQIIAFCDDDAVPEPTWLERLVEPFHDPNTGAAGGLVRGRNGVSVQWGFQEVDGYGNDWPVPASGAAFFGAPTPGRVLKTVGTNCAFRRAALAAIGGFDEAYRFFLEETDANWRLAAAGWQIAGVPAAEVHHGYGPSALRTSERIPRSLHEIGASKIYFCRSHGEAGRITEELDGFRDDQRRRLTRAVLLGLLPPTAVSSLLTTLEAGYIAGARRTAQLPKDLQCPRSEARPYATGPKPDSFLLAHVGVFRRRNRRAAAEAARSGAQTVTLIELDYTARPLTVRFTDDGYWHHRGGLLGQTGRSEPLVRLTDLRQRRPKEIARVAAQRGLE